MVPQQYCLRWKHHHTNVQNMFAQLLEKERFCDVTLYCSPNFATQVPNKDTVDPQNIRGVSLRAHRVVLAACSELLGALLGAHEAQGEPVLVIDGAEPRHLKALLDYMYTGEMNVHHSQLASLLKTAEELRIKGLTDIRWNNKDEPPDCDQGVVTATATATQEKRIREPTVEKSPERKNTDKNTIEHKNTHEHKNTEAKNTHEQERCRNDSDTESNARSERFNVNGGPPPLIKLPTKEKSSPIKRENSDTDSPSPKRKRVASGTDHTDDESISQPKSEREEWQHGNLDITAERVVGWGMGSIGAESSRDLSDDEWADAPADIGCFLHTKLRVDGDNSADEESNDAGDPPSTSTSTPSAPTSASPCIADIKIEMPHSLTSKPTTGPKSGPTDPRFTDVVKLNDYLQHGRRPQFWEENYVKRVMEAVRMKELEMKQAAEILGVSYGTLYGRYRDVYGCINRPYRGTRDYWQSKGPSEVLERFQRGEITLDAASLALGVSTKNLAAYVADFGQLDKDFEPIPIEIDPSLKMVPRTYSAALASLSKTAPPRKTVAASPGEKSGKKILIGNLNDDDPIPATVITTHEGKNFNATATTMASSGKWPTIRVASLETLRSDPPASPHAPAPATPTSPSQLMRTRPDLTIVAARKPDPKRDDEES